MLGVLGAQAQDEDVASPEPAPPAPSTVTPPRVVESPPARYPPDALSEGHGALVRLRVTVLIDGTVGDVEVVESAGELFDEAATTAVQTWRFEPATREGEPLASRIEVPFRFRLPEVEPVETGDGAPDAVPAASIDPDSTPSERFTEPSTESSKQATEATSDVVSGAEAEEPMEVLVQGERPERTEDRSVGDFRLRRDVLAAAPRQEGAEVLRSAPGLYIGRGEGAALAHNYVLRGFDAEHGQDIEFRVGGLPINLPSHLHGQGYADLGFLIGDVVQELRVSEGVYDPRQGDFAVAGSIDLSLGVEPTDRGVRLRSSYGSFNTFRQLLLWAPRGDAEESFGAAQYTRSDGFGENRAGQGGSAIVQHRFGYGDVSFRALGILYAARADHAGVVRRDDVDAGRVCFDCVYPYPTARGQNALANRVLTGVFADYEGDEGQSGQAGFWFGYDNFRSQTNFTGFIERSRTLERVAGRGDLIEQQNRTLSFGVTGRYRTSPFRPTSWAHGTVELGVDGRLDAIDQAQNLLDAAVRNQTWDRRVDASVRGVDVGLWGDLDWGVTRYVRARLGFRADVLSYDVEDRLGNFVPLTRPDDAFIVGFRRSALGFAAGPRTSVEVNPLPWLSFKAAYGEGYRSPQARMLEDGEPAPFSKVRSTDFGVQFDGGPVLQLTVGGYYTRLSDDVAFEAGEGRLERIGATERLGAVVYAITKPTRWLIGSLSLTWVDATLREPPPPSAEEPDPPFSKGSSLPFVPPVVLRMDAGAHHALVDDLGGRTLDGRAGFGFSYLSARPLPFGGSAESFGLLDTSVGVTWGPIDLSFEVFNLLDANYAAVEYNFASDWNPDDGFRPRTPARHLAAGAPRTWMASLGVTL